MTDPQTEPEVPDLEEQLAHQADARDSADAGEYTEPPQPQQPEIQAAGEDSI